MKIENEMKGVRSSGDNEKAYICENNDGRLVIRTYTQSGFDCTEIDMLDLVNWLHNPENNRLIEAYKPIGFYDEFPGCPEGCTCEGEC